MREIVIPSECEGSHGTAGMRSQEAASSYSTRVIVIPSECGGSQRIRASQKRMIVTPGDPSHPLGMTIVREA